MILVTCQPRIINPGNSRMRFEPAGNGTGVFNMTLHPYMQGFEPLNKLEGIERRYAGAHITEQRHPHFDDIRNISESFPVFKAVIGGVRLGKFGKITIIPREFTTIHNRATYACAMSADEFCQ